MRAAHRDSAVLPFDVRSRLQFIASQVSQAQRLSADDDTLLDVLDGIDSEIQVVIAIVNRLRTAGDAS